MKYYSELTEKLYNSEKELQNAEKLLEEQKKKAEQERKEALAKQEKIRTERSLRAKEVQEAFDKANGLLDKFIKDYKNYHIEFKTESPFSFISDFFSSLF